MASIEELIGELERASPRRQREIGDALLLRGEAAAPAMERALRSAEEARIRRPLAFLLGKLRQTPARVSLLARLLAEDPDPKVRKNAAVALGRLGAAEAEGGMIEALRQETFASVRSSLILSLGALGGEPSRLLLEGWQADDPKESEALRLALDRLRPRGPALHFREEERFELPLLLEVPRGLEEVALAELDAARGPGGAVARPGLLQCAPGTPPWGLLPSLRCAYGVRVPVVRVEGSRGRSLAALSELLERCLRELGRSGFLSRWIEGGKEGEPLSYRLDLGGLGLSRRDKKETLTRARRVASRLSLKDNPSHYAFELIFETEGSLGRLFFKPHFEEDRRFAYRLRDVGASIHPVVAACLARLIFTGEGKRVYDPTCGSGTLLVERARLDPTSRLRGTDISRVSIEAAAANVEAAELGARIAIRRADATAEAWEEVDEVLANLPFGLRAKEEERSLRALYRGILRRLAASLAPGGRALLYATAQGLVEGLLEEAGGRLRVLDRLWVQSGGLGVRIWVLAPGGRGSSTGGRPRRR